jgi:hypothetical protein
MKTIYIRLVALSLLCCGLSLSTGCQKLFETGEEIADLIRDDGTLCLDDLLGVIDMSRDELGDEADAELESILSEQEEVLGMAYVVDCVAIEQVTALTTRPAPMIDHCMEDPCNANGVCNEEDGSCACNEGYTGYDCTRCDSGFSALEDGTCMALACADDSCGGNGVCADTELEGAWAASCDCHTGYTGDQCADCGEGYAALADGVCAMMSCTEESCSARGACSEVEAEGMWTNSCECNEGFIGDHCEDVADGYILLSTGEALPNPCAEDTCNGNGECSWNETPEGGVVSECWCDTGYAGDTCEGCDEANLFFDAEGVCIQSECPESCRESATGTCDDENPANTACVCDEGYAGANCQQCATGYDALTDETCGAVVCDETSCNGNGACADVEVDGAWAASCDCHGGYDGETCDGCSDGYQMTGSGVCMLDTCANGLSCNGNGTCEWNADEGVAGECSCEGNFAGADCSACTEGFVGAACDTCDLGYVPLSGGRCILDPCGNDGCSDIGYCSINDEDGAAVCDCPEGYDGADCELCAEGFEGHPDCRPIPPPEPQPTIVEECENPGTLVACISPQIGKEMREDVVLLLDATGSMRDDRDRIQNNLSDVVSNVAMKEGRVAIAWYKDNQGCNDDWYGLNENGLLPLYDDDVMMNEEALLTFISDINVRGGCDLPESMLDAIYETVTRVEWESNTSRALVILTDAAFHTGEKSNHSQEEVDLLLATHGVSLRIVNVALAY